MAMSVLLFNANRLPKKESSPTQTPSKGVISSLSDVVKKLPETDKKNWSKIEALLKQTSKKEEKRHVADSAIFFWDQHNRPDFAAAFAEQKAELSGNVKDWNYAGQRFYYAVKFFEDSPVKKTLFLSAKRCFEKVLSLDPKNTDARIDIASCIVESGENPMQGISMLREIEKTDSNNVRLQLSFGFFSAKSQQWEKAIKRFSKALEIDSNYIEVHLHLADAYERKGKKDSCIKHLEIFISKTNDEMAKATIREYVNKIKNN